MRSIALLGTAAALAAATSVVGLEHGNIPMPRRRPRVKPAPIMTETDYTWLEQRQLELAEHERKITAAAAKRARKAEKLKAVAAAGGITPLKLVDKEPGGTGASLMVEVAMETAKKPKKRAPSKKTTTF